MTKKTINYHKFDRMAELTFCNALRLHFDAVALFCNKSYPSAYFLSILSQEEFGKVFMIDDMTWHARIEGSELFLNEIYKHKAKQQWFVGHDPMFRFARRFLDEVSSGKLDLLKQDSVYVGLKGKSVKGRITSPSGISERKARKHILIVSKVLLNIVNLEIQGVTEWDNGMIHKALNRKLLIQLENKKAKMNKGGPIEVRND